MRICSHAAARTPLYPVAPAGAYWVSMGSYVSRSASVISGVIIIGTTSMTPGAGVTAAPSTTAETLTIYPHPSGRAGTTGYIHPPSSATAAVPAETITPSASPIDTDTDVGT